MTVLVGLAGGARVAAAAGPAAAVSTATPTSTSWVPTQTPALPPATATPLPATPTFGAAMQVAGGLWIDARPAGQRFAAFIGGVECAREDQVIVGTDGAEPIGLLTIPSATDEPGCGTPGAVVHFAIDGRPANETLLWAAGADVNTRFTVGPPFAIFNGSFRPPTGLAGVVAPLIAGAVCGAQINPTLGLGPDYGYEVVVDPSALHAGCGVAGATVQFAFAPYAGNRVGPLLALADETAVWQPGGGSTLDLTFSGASTLPPTGTGPRADDRVSMVLVAELVALLGAMAVLVGSARVRGA